MDLAPAVMLLELAQVVTTTPTTTVVKPTNPWIPVGGAVTAALLAQLVGFLASWHRDRRQEFHDALDRLSDAGNGMVKAMFTALIDHSITPETDRPDSLEVAKLVWANAATSFHRRFPQESKIRFHLLRLDELGTRGSAAISVRSSFDRNKDIRRIIVSLKNALFDLDQMEREHPWR